MKYYKFIFLNGTVNYGTGDSVGGAFSNAGFGGGALSALDYFTEISKEDYASATA